MFHSIKCWCKYFLTTGRSPTSKFIRHLPYDFVAPGSNHGSTAADLQLVLQYTS